MQFDGRLDPNTPMGLLRGIKYGTESYHVLFKRLCRLVVMLVHVKRALISVTLVCIV